MLLETAKQPKTACAQKQELISPTIIMKSTHEVASTAPRWESFQFSRLSQRGADAELRKNQEKKSHTRTFSFDLSIECVQDYQWIEQINERKTRTYR